MFFIVFSMLGLFLFLVLFTAGGNLKTHVKHCRVDQDQGFQRMKKHIFKVRFRMDLGVSFNAIFIKKVISLRKKGCKKTH